MILPRFFFVVFLFLTFNSSRAQVVVSGCINSINVPNFSSDTAFSDESNILVRKKVIEPLKTSKSIIEIRIFKYPYFAPGPVYIIKCDQGNFKIDEYWINRFKLTPLRHFKKPPFAELI